MILTTTHSVEGYEITEYMGIVSGETTLGTGFVSETFANVADFFGQESGAFAGKLSQSKTSAIEKMKESAAQLCADAIIGIDVDVMLTNANMFVSCANGTAVRLKKKGGLSDDGGVGLKRLAISNYGENLPVRFGIGYFTVNEDKSITVTFEGKTSSSNSVESLMVNIKYITAFGEEIITEDRRFMLIPSENGFKMSYKESKFEINDLSFITDIKLYLIYYISNGKLFDASKVPTVDINMDNKTLVENRIKYGMDYCNEFVEEENRWKCMCGCNYDKTVEVCSFCGKTVKAAAYGNDNDYLYQTALQKKNAIEIYDLYNRYFATHDSPMLAEHMKKLESYAELDRMYGNKKAAAIKYIEENMI